MRGPTLSTILQKRYIVVALDNNDIIISCKTVNSSKEARYWFSVFKAAWEEHRVSVYKLTPCRY
ncbi:MAG: hypothetical protein DRP41_00340 [Thermodesulfobacteriota bacterium]|nr:MAG: hypothetical protein DRP41_00340 [Thermodesulfobacteriota bacterium]